MSNQTKSINLTPDNFKSEVLESNIPVLVDFWAAWCGPCQVMNPIVANLAQEWSGKVKVGKANVDDNETIATEYNIQAIPTILIFRDGEIVERFTRIVSQATLTEKLNELTRSVVA
jgi:thioredoxin 1